MQIATTASAATLPPADRVFRSHFHDFGSLYGLSFFGWGINAPEEVHVAVYDPELLALDKHIVRDVVDGIHIAFQQVSAGARATDLTRVYYPQVEGSRQATRGAMRVSLDGTPWYDRSSSMARAVATLPGVIAYGHDGLGEDQPWTFWCDTKEDVARLKEFVRDDLDGAGTRYVVGRPPMTARLGA